MNFVKRLKLFAALLVLSIGCFGLVVYENTVVASVGASSANLIVPTYTVGSEYAGTITRQYVNGGETVKDGQKLFELKSDQLTSALASGQLKEANLTSQLNDDGAIVLSAQHDGVVSEVNYLKGSFVSPGKPIAVIKGTDVASVRASFELSGPQYAKLNPGSPITVHFAGKDMMAKISGITQQSNNGHTFTVIDAKLPSITQDQTVYNAGTPMTVHVILDTNTLYNRLHRLVQTS